MSASNLAMMQALMALNPQVSQMVQPTQPNPQAMRSPGQQAMVAPMSFGGGRESIINSMMGPQQPPAQMGPQQPQAQMAPDMAGPPAPDINQLQRDAQNAAVEYQSTQTNRFGGLPGLIEKIIEAPKEPKAREKLLDAQQALAQEQTNLSETALTKRANTVKDAVFTATQDKGLANAFGDISRTDPKTTSKILEQIGEQATRAPDKAPELVRELISAGYEPGTEEFRDMWTKIKMKSGQTINVGKDEPSIMEQSLLALYKNGKAPKNREAWLAGDTSEGVIDLTDVEKKDERRMEVINSAAMVTDRTDQIRKVMDDPEGILPTTGGGGALVRKITDALDPPTREGDKSRFAYFTRPGEIDALLEPIKAKIGLQTINQMRQMSATGGALGNVSNFEVRMVQAALDALEPGRGDEGFRSALDNVDLAFNRAAFFANNGQDMVNEANKLGVDPVEFINKELNQRFPLNPEFFGRISQTPIPWEADDTAPQAVVPGATVPIQTDDGWSITEQ